MMFFQFNSSKSTTDERMMMVSWLCLTWKIHKMNGKLKKFWKSEKLKIRSIILSSGLAGHLSTIHTNLLFISPTHRKLLLPLSESLNANEKGQMMMKRLEFDTKLSLHIALINSNNCLLVLLDCVTVYQFCLIIPCSIMYYLIMYWICLVIRFVYWFYFFFWTSSWLDFAKSITLFTPDRIWTVLHSCAKGRRCFNEDWRFVEAIFPKLNVEIILKCTLWIVEF